MAHVGSSDLDSAAGCMYGVLTGATILVLIGIVLWILFY